ncbi:HAD-IA family hydrolase [Alteromonas sp. KUL106]|uniref:HAD-IA family hydrolase n=1 Tax=Alteromonas sp. KUL106 TaxID=2480799 RepID=UPI0012E456DD|nr:HAD-IA family hydrolase [Alteromonas sp. KUL106]GFD68887.1 flavin mononucleotide phosphatase [Alteromonas sp. KUL106]
MQFFRSINHIDAMTFDLDDTLYNNDPIIRRAEQALQAHIAQYHPEAAKLTSQDWLQLKRAAIAKDRRLASDMGQLRRVVLTAALSGTSADKLDVKVNNRGELSDAVEACFNCFYDARSNFDLADDVHHVLKALSNKRPLIGITNGNVNAQKIGIEGYFETILHASTTRPMKPAREMFDEAADHLGIAPKHILHVGDNLIKDVKGAINAGYQAAWFACNRQMKLANEPVSVLPHIALDDLNELTYFL